MSKYIKRNKVRTLLIAFLLLFVLVVSVANSRMLSPYFFRPVSSTELTYSIYRTSDGGGGWENYRVSDGVGGWSTYGVRD